MKSKRRYRWVFFVFAGMAIVVGVAVWFILSRPKPIPPEKLVNVEKGDIARSVVAIGHVEALSKVQVKSKANGIIQALLVDVGDRVKENQILAELDKDNPQAEVREGKATLDAEEANLKIAFALEAKSRIEAANPELDFAQREYVRSAKLYGEGIASAQALDDAKKAQDLAANRRQLLEASVQTAEAQVVQARARVAAARAALDRAEENLKNATIRSPIDGMVLTRDTEVGDAVSSILNLGSAATLIMTLGDLSSVYIKGEIDETDVGKIQTNMPARIKVESFPGEVFKGTVSRIAPMGRERDNVRTFEVRVAIANLDSKLRVNMSANAEIVLEEHTNALLIAEAAIVYGRDGKPAVQQRDPAAREGYRKISIRTGISNGQRTEVLEGLALGTTLALP
jgi:HlyD family secretion protein